jgi:parallel beta-helix repeat protein
MLPDSDEKTQEGCTDDAFELGVDLLYPGKNDTLRYVYIVKTDIPYNITVGAISVSNSITDNKISPHITYLDTVEELPELTSPSSLHPWEISVTKNKTVVLAGEVILQEDLILNKEDTLIILPNTTIYLAPDVSIISYGKVLAEGTSKLPISFLPLNNEQPWGAIALQGDGANGSLFSYCVIEGGSGAEYELVHYTGMLSAYNTEITVDHCILRNNKDYDDAFNAKYSNVKIINSKFSNIFSDAIDLDISEGSIEENTFVDINGDAIDLMTSTPLVKNNDIRNASDKGISVGEMSNPLIINNTIAVSNTAIAIKDRSDPLIINNTLISNTIGVAVYEKNWQYGGGGLGMIEGTTLCQNAQPILIQNSSLIRIKQNGSIIECTESECALLCE